MELKIKILYYLFEEMLYLESLILNWLVFDTILSCIGGTENIPIILAKMGGLAVTTMA